MGSIEIRQSKKYIIFTCICGLLIILFFLGLAIFALISFIKDYPSKNSNELSGDIFMLCFSLIVILIIIMMVSHILVVYKKQVDIYTPEKLIRKRGDKIIFELPYDNIIAVKEGAFDLLAMQLKSHIIEANGKKGTRNFFEHYSRTDITRIKRIISEKFYDIQFQ